MKASKAVAALTITGFECDPAQITKELQIVPAKLWRRGDPVLIRRPEARKYKENGWRHTVEVTGGEGDPALWLGTAVDHLMSVVLENLSRFSQLPASSSIEISCYVRIGDEAMPMIHFDKETVNLIASIGASIDVDLMLDV